MADDRDTSTLCKPFGHAADIFKYFKVDTHVIKSKSEHEDRTANMMIFGGF
jgi:hypothetical protein